MKLINPNNNNRLFLDSKKNCYVDGNNEFKIIKKIPRFVDTLNYANNFGFQWNKFREIQIDNSEFNLSYKRFFAQIDKKPQDLDNKKILEVGCGAGRFTNILLKHTNAEVHSVDLSNAVEANLKNHEKYYNKRLFLYQADVYKLPFESNSFDFVFCFGVLQHTPNIKKTLESLIKMTIPKKEIIVDFYPIKGWYTKIHAKYILRPILNKLSNEKLYNLINYNVDWLMKTYIFLKKIKLGKLTRFLPLCDFDTDIIKNLDKKKLREWVLLDTFDQYSTAYDSPQKIKNIKKYFEELNCKVYFADMVKFDDHISAVVRSIKK
tara:strand:- start:188 stop:1147 length:960 start_codon:yes stop_codon:yes gene_type:complete